MSGNLANGETQSAYWYAVAQKYLAELAALRNANAGLAEQVELQDRLIDELRDDLVQALAAPGELVVQK